MDPEISSCPDSPDRDPSLEFCNDWEEPRDLLLKAMQRHHDSLNEQLLELRVQVQQLSEGLDSKRMDRLRRSSTQSNASAGLPARSHSHSTKKAGKDSLAMEVLQMDMSHLGTPMRSLSLKKIVPPRGSRSNSKKPEDLLPNTAQLPGALEQEQGRQDLADILEEGPSARSTTNPTRSFSKDDSRFGTQTSRSLSKDEDTLSLSIVPKSSTSDPRDKTVLFRGGSAGSALLEVAEKNSRGDDAESSREDPQSPKDSKEKHRTISMSSYGREKSRRSSAILDRAVSKGNLSEVFRLREQELTATLSARNSNRADNEKSRDKAAILQEMTNEDGLTSDDDQDEKEDIESPSVWLRFSFVNHFVSGYVSKALGLVPLFDDMKAVGWRRRCRTLAARSYHWLLIFFLLYNVVRLALDLSFCRSQENEDHETCCMYWPPLAVDMFMLVGALMVLCSWGGFWNYTGNTALVGQSVAELTAYCNQNGLEDAQKVWMASDALWALLVWLLMLFGRFTGFAFNSWMEGEWTMKTLPFVATYSLSTGILVVASFWQFRTSHAMLLIVNSWSASVLRGEESCIHSKHEWKRVSGLFRKTSRAFERCFSALAATIVMIILSALFDMSHRWNLEMLASVSFAFILPGVLWTHASTTSACNRLPSLVMLCEVEDEDEDAEYMDLAMFLSLSECGFFVWDTCVTIGLVQKFLYFTAAIAGSIGFQAGAFNLSSLTIAA